MSRTTPKSELLLNHAASATLPDPLVFSMEGYPGAIIQLDSPGSGAGFSWSLTSRVPAAAGADVGIEPEWESAALASGSLSGTNTATVTIQGDRGELKLTFSSASSTPKVRVWVHRSAA